MASSSAAAAGKASSSGGAASSPPPPSPPPIDRLWGACVDADWDLVDALCDECAAFAGAGGGGSGSESKSKGGSKSGTEGGTKSRGEGGGSGGDDGAGGGDGDGDASSAPHDAFEARDASLRRPRSHPPRTPQPPPHGVPPRRVRPRRLVPIRLAVLRRRSSDAVDAEGRRQRLEFLTRGRDRGGGEATDPVGVEDFCPYVAMLWGSDGSGLVEAMLDEGLRRKRRRAVARLCRLRPAWICAPMVPPQRRAGEEGGEDDERGTTPLHVAVRCRSVALVRLLLKFAPRAASIPDAHGCLPLHLAVRPADEAPVSRRSAATYAAAARPPREAPELGPAEANAGRALAERGTRLFKSWRVCADLGRCRVRRLKWKRKASAAKEMAEWASGCGAKRAGVVEGGGGRTGGVGDAQDGTKEGDGPVVSFPNAYDGPPLLVRALMELETVEEDSPELVAAEWDGGGQSRAGGRDRAGLSRRGQREAGGVAGDDAAVEVAASFGRSGRRVCEERGDWRMFFLCLGSSGLCVHRTKVTKSQATVGDYALRLAMLHQCNDGGDTPLMLACLTLEGDNEDDDDFDDMMDEGEDDDDVEGGDGMDDEPDNNGNAPPDAIGEEAANYEADLPPLHGAAGGEPDTRPTPRAQGPTNRSQPMDNGEIGGVVDGPVDPGLAEEK